ncbi:MAG TPA: hypothetical protein VFV24_01370, partial [Candidatus Eisenbacteria bacterium]|nr:hypothetical protein [Candidatus Eisenbacteria bacterium]
SPPRERFSRLGPHILDLDPQSLVQEIGADRFGSTSTDASGRFEMIVRPGVLHNLWVQPSSGGTYIVNGIASSADSTFDIPINVPVP